MRKKFLGIILGTVVGSFIVTISASAKIEGSKHDFSGPAYPWSGGQVCNICHTPHNVKVDPLVPLWNHTSTSATYTLYQSSTLNAIVGQPTGSSKACLSCHDGTVAVDAFGSGSGSVYIAGGSTKLIGTNLSNDHPISFAYNAVLAGADSGLRNPGDSSVQALLKGANKDNVECSSCHDVHNTANIPGLLVKTNAGSALCLTCHVK